jgi:plastocyanin
MTKSVFVGVVLAGAAAVAAIALMVTMMAMMGRGHSAMMGGRGSNPASETPVQGETQVRIEDFAFAPANIVVKAGTTVTWTNYDGVGHTVTSDEGDELDSELLGGNEAFSHTFDQPGAYRYHCTPHPNMRGLVTVRAPGSLTGAELRAAGRS